MKDNCVETLVCVSFNFIIKFDLQPQTVHSGIKVRVVSSISNFHDVSSKHLRPVSLMIMKASWPEFEDYFHNFIFMKVNVPLTLPLWRGEIFKETNAGIS